MISTIAVGTDGSGRAAEAVLVIGNKGMQRRVLGSVPNTVTHKASCSVLVVKTS
jgi:nucleotide-binding universal stress UspA family protein